MNYKITKNVSTTTTMTIINITIYRSVNDKNNHYEFRFEYNPKQNYTKLRLMILFNGTGRTCTDYWTFFVGRRILAYLRRYQYFILAICSKRMTFNCRLPLQNNTDAKSVYTFLQQWVHEIFYTKFHQYPRLYIHGVSRGSNFAGLMSRILPIQGKICTIYPSNYQMMQTNSDYPQDFLTSLLNPIFANWFYFEYCYFQYFRKSNTDIFCPFENLEKNYFQPVPPTYFNHLQNDGFIKKKYYTSLINEVRKNAFQLGGKLLNHSESLQLFILPPLNVTFTSLQEYFEIWQSKPHARAFFYMHYSNRTLFKNADQHKRTCLCLPVDFQYYESYPNLTRTWSKKQQDEYHDYATDIKIYRTSFCEDVCGDLYTSHAIPSRHLDKALDWLNQMDSLRSASI